MDDQIESRMTLRNRVDAAIDVVWLRCETSVVWFTATAMTVALLVFGVGYGVVALIWR